jgi:hypothetical protein
MGCTADDNCPATILCAFHYQVQGLAYGDMQSFGILDSAILKDESYSEEDRAQFSCDPKCDSDTDTRGFERLA